MRALASSGSPWGGVGEGPELPPIWAQSKSGGSPRTNSPHYRDPFPTSFTGPLSSQPPLAAGNQVRERGKGMGLDSRRGDPSYLLLPTGCLFAQSAPPNLPRLRRKRQVRGPHSLGTLDCGFPPRDGRRRAQSDEVGAREKGPPQLLPNSGVYTGPHSGALRHCISSAVISGLGEMALSAIWGTGTIPDWRPECTPSHKSAHGLALSPDTEGTDSKCPPALQVRRGHPTVHSETKYVELIVINDHQLVSSGVAVGRGGPWEETPTGASLSSSIPPLPAV